jgi:hypothetical protein
VYSGYFLPWDTFSNINRLETNFVAAQTIITPITPIQPVPIVENIIVPDEDIKPKGVNTSNVDTPSSQQISQQSISTGSGLSRGSGFSSGRSFMFNPRWKADRDAILLTYSAPKYKSILDKRALEIKLTQLGFLSPIKLNKLIDSRKTIDASIELNNKKISYLLGYFKGLNIIVDMNIIDKFFKTENLKSDLNDYVNSGITRQRTKKGIGLKDTEVTVGEFIPKDRKDFNLILANKIIEQNPIKKGGIQSRLGTNEGQSPPPAPTVSAFREYVVIIPIFPKALANNFLQFDWNKFKDLNNIRNNLFPLPLGRVIKLPSNFTIPNVAKLFIRQK